MGTPPTSRWLLRDVTVGGAVTDCLIDAGVVAALGTGLPRVEGADVIEGGGGALLPGLADHHTHLFAAAAAHDSLDLAGAGDLAALAEWPGSGWIRAVGAGTELVRGDIDRVLSDRPVRVQHRSGALWTLNTPAVELLAAGLTPDERASGQLWRAEERLRRLLGPRPAPDLSALGSEYAAWGVTHLTEATPDVDEETRRAWAAVPQHILALGAADGPGPRKIVVADHPLPSLGDLVARVAAAHEAGRPVALHAVSAVTLAVALAAVQAVGPAPGDRIEHAAVCDRDAAELIAELGLTVVTQPSVFARHGEAYLRDSEPHERRWLWRYGSLRAQGVAVAVSSDAPYGDPNPWETVRAAATRTGPDRVPADVVLASLLADPRWPAGPPRRLHVGGPADLCLLGGALEPMLTRAVAGGSVPVRATFIGGVPVHLG